VAAIAALASAPVLLAASSALAFDIYFDQITGAAGGALGIVGGPVGGLVGGLLGKQIGLKIHPRPKQIDNSDMESRAHVMPISQGRIIEPGEGVEDRAVDSTPVRMVELRPPEAEAQTYLASAPIQAPQARAYQISARHRGRMARRYLASAPRPAETASAPPVIPVSLPAGGNPGAPPGTLDYQLNQLNAGHAADAPVVEQVADVR
jgi:hypothetical protein